MIGADVVFEAKLVEKFRGTWFYSTHIGRYEKANYVIAIRFLISDRLEA